MGADQKKGPEVLNYLLQLPETHWRASAEKGTLFKQGAGEAVGYGEQSLQPAEA